MPSEFDNVVYYEAAIVIEDHLITSENAKVIDIAVARGFELNNMMLTRVDVNFQPLRVATDAIINELRAARFFICSVKIAAIVYEEKLI